MKIAGIMKCKFTFLLPVVFLFTVKTVFAQSTDEETLAYTPVDVLSTPTLFVCLSDGGVDAYPLSSLDGEYYSIDGTLYVPLSGSDAIEYPHGSYTGYTTDCPSLPTLTSYKFNNKYNPNLNVDVIADSISDVMTFDLNAIGKSLTASFQLSDDRAVAYIGNEVQYSKESRRRFSGPVQYVVTYPGYNVLSNVKVQDEIWDTGDDIVSEIPLTSEMLYTNKPSEVGDDLNNMLDNDPTTIFHTVYGANYDAGVMPYITITLDAAVSALQFYYMTRTGGNYNPSQLNLYVSADGSSWQLVRGFSSSADSLPLDPAGAEYTSPTVDLGGSYRYIKLEQTASEYHNNHMVFAEFRLYDVVPGNKEPVKIQDAVYENVKMPFGRIYTVNTNWLADTSPVPRIDIDIDGGLSVTSKEYYLGANFRISGFGMYDDFEDSVQIKGRGNTTWSYSKKPYRLKFSSAVKPFGLTKGKSWVLLANAQGGALMANAVAMKVGQLAGASYTNHIIPVELYMNGEYKGNYMFTEHVGFSNNSVDIDEDSGTGYMLELDSYYDEDYRFRSSYYSLPVNVKEPDLPELDEAAATMRFNNIKADFNRFDSLVYCNAPLSDVLDMEAAARFMLTNELVMNQELGHPKSTYLWKENVTSPESKIVLGPLWDFDWAFGYEGTGSYFTKDYTSSFLASSMSYESGYSFFSALMNNDEFKRYYYKVWMEFIENNCIQEIVEYISDYYDFAEPSFVNNATVWGDGGSYGTKISAMQSWMQNRHNYIVDNLTEYDISDLLYTLLGDIDCNNLQTVHDVVILANYLMGTTDEAFNIAKADVDKNGSIDIYDLANTVSAVAAGEQLSSIYYYDTPVSGISLSADEFQIHLDETETVPVIISSNDVVGYKALQADITIPFGMVLLDAVAGNALNGMDFMLNQVGEEQYRVLAYSEDGRTFTAEDVLMNLQLYMADNISDDDKQVVVNNILVVNGDDEELRVGELSIAFNNNVTVEEYTITYVVDGEEYASAIVAYGSEIGLIAPPVKDGHSFSGWVDAPSVMPAEDIIISGSFSVNSYTITYVVDGEEYASAIVAYGSEIGLIAPPVKDGHSFSGWVDAPSVMPAEDIIISGSFSVNSYTITYVVDGEEYASAIVAYGSEIGLIAPPVKDGHSFSGWVDAPSVMPAEDIIISGSFSVNSYTITYVVDGEEYASAIVAYGSEIGLIAPPVKDGHSFSGWVDAPSVMPAEDIIISGSFVPNTGILGVQNDTESVIYDLRGNRVEEITETGVYIINGKKVLVRKK